MFEGVKTMVLPPCQWNEPATVGVIENARWATSGFTSSLKAILMDVRTSATPLPEVLLSWMA